MKKFKLFIFLITIIRFGSYCQIDINSFGNVGVGTTTPENSENWDRVLNVHGQNHSKIITTTSNVHTGIWSHNSGFYGAPTGGIVGTRSNHPFSIITNQSSKLTILSNGNVGIGYTSPIEKLNINGNIYMPNGTSLWIGNNNDASYRLRLHSTSSYGAFIDYYNYLYFRTGATNSSIKTMILGSNGNVTLGYQDPATSGYKLYIQGSVWCTGSYEPSDSMLKSNINIITGALDKLMELKGVEYNYDASKLKKFTTKPKLSDNDSISFNINENNTVFQDIEKQKRMGFIGQDFEKVFPECTKKDNDLIAINYTDLIPVVVEAIKEQQTIIENLQKEIENLKKAVKVK